MPDRVLGFLRGTPAPDRIPEYHDPVLGQLALAPENPEWWEANLTLGGRPVRIGVGGGREPDPTLLARAQEIVRDFESLERRLAAFLAREAREHSYLRAWSEEIAALCIEGVHLFWPERPTEGVIFFEGRRRTAAGVRVSRATSSGASPSTRSAWRRVRFAILLPNGRWSWRTICGSGFAAMVISRPGGRVMVATPAAPHLMRCPRRSTSGVSPQLYAIRGVRP